MPGRGFIKLKNKIILPLSFLIIHIFSTDLLACGACQDYMVSFYFPFSYHCLVILVVWLALGITYQISMKLYQVVTKKVHKFPLNYIKILFIYLLIYIIGLFFMLGILIPSLGMLCYLSYRTIKHIFKNAKEYKLISPHEKFLMALNALFIVAIIVVIPPSYINYRDTDKLIAKLGYSVGGPTNLTVNALIKKGEEIVPDLIRTLSEGQEKHSEKVLINVIYILEKFKDERFIPPLINILINAKYHGDYRDIWVDTMLTKALRLISTLDPSITDIQSLLPQKIKLRLDKRNLKDNKEIYIH